MKNSCHQLNGLMGDDLSQVENDSGKSYFFFRITYKIMSYYYENSIEENPATSTEISPAWKPGVVAG